MGESLQERERVAPGSCSQDGRCPDLQLQPRLQSPHSASIHFSSIKHLLSLPRPAELRRPLPSFGFYKLAVGLQSDSGPLSRYRLSHVQRS
jgi:hypothetical protein